MRRFAIQHPCRTTSENGQVARTFGPAKSDVSAGGGSGWTSRLAKLDSHMDILDMRNRRRARTDGWPAVRPFCPRRFLP